MRKLVDGQAANIDAGEWRVPAVQQDRSADIRLGLLLPVVLDRSDDGERGNRAAVGEDEVAFFAHLHALEQVVSAARDRHLPRDGRALPDEAAIQ